MGMRHMNTGLRWRALGPALAIGLLAASPIAAFAESDSSAFNAAAQAYKQEATAQIDAVIASADAMAAAMQQGDFATARKAWLESHAGWERLEVITDDLYPDLQDGIDGWPNSKTGYHAVETWLFAQTPQFPKWETAELLDELNRFRRVLAQTEINGYFLLAGTATLAFEMGEDQSDARESALSGTSIVDMRHNMEGLSRVWSIFADAVALKHKDLADDINTRIAGIVALLDVSSDDQLDGATIKQETEELAAKLAAAAVALGWAAPNYKDLD
jgi:iron uptake system component EfeO